MFSIYPMGESGALCIVSGMTHCDCIFCFCRRFNISLYCIATKIAPDKVGGCSLVSYVSTCKSGLQVGFLLGKFEALLG